MVVGSVRGRWKPSMAPDQSYWYPAETDLQLKDVQEKDQIDPLENFGTHSRASPMQIISLNIISGVPLLIVRTDYLGQEYTSSGETIDIQQHGYRMFTTDDPEWKPTSKLIGVGDIRFSASDTDDDDYAHPSTSNTRVTWSEIAEELRSKGIGKYIYKTAINDQFDLGYSFVNSDTTEQQSEQADFIWQSIHLSNPERVDLPWPDESRRYTAIGYIQRRPPVHVHGHRRRRA